MVKHTGVPAVVEVPVGVHPSARAIHVVASCFPPQPVLNNKASDNHGINTGFAS